MTADAPSVRSADRTGRPCRSGQAIQKKTAVIRFSASVRPK